MADVIAPTVPKCHAHMNTSRLAPQTKMPAHSAPARLTPAARTAAAPSHGKPNTNQKTSAAP